MTKIVYGVSGEGSGHSSRAREIASFLCQCGHDVRLASYDRGYRNLKDDFDVLEIEGLTISSADNRVSVVKTFTENLKRLPEGHRSLQRLRREFFKEWEPDIVITDFEPMTAYLAHHYDLPLVTIDNQHRMRYLEYDCPPQLQFEAQVTKNIIRAMVPKPDVSLVTAFYRGQPTNDRTFVFPPILRQEVLERTPTNAGHVLVYVTSGFETLLDVLKHFPREQFIVYGYNRNDREEQLLFRPFSKNGFLDDLAGAKAVMATAGFTLISEALSLHKPYLAFPMQGQFEQQLNAMQLSSLGYGKHADEPRPEVVGDFLYRLPEYEAKLAGYTGGDNSEIKERVCHLAADNGRLAKEFHDRRR